MRLRNVPLSGCDTNGTVYVDVGTIRKVYYLGAAPTHECMNYTINIEKISFFLWSYSDPQKIRYLNYRFRAIQRRCR